MKNQKRTSVTKAKGNLNKRVFKTKSQKKKKIEECSDASQAAKKPTRMMTEKSPLASASRKTLSNFDRDSVLFIFGPQNLLWSLGYGRCPPHQIKEWKYFLDSEWASEGREWFNNDQ